MSKGSSQKVLSRFAVGPPVRPSKLGHSVPLSALVIEPRVRECAILSQMDPDTKQLKSRRAPLGTFLHGKLANYALPPPVLGRGHAVNHSNLRRCIQIPLRRPRP